MAQVASYGAFYLAAFWLLGLPLAIYQGFIREHQYGLATQTFGAWFGEQAMALGVALVIGTPAIVAIYAVIRRAPRRWWIGAAIVAIGVIAVGAALRPIFIGPPFDTCKPPCR